MPTLFTIEEVLAESAEGPADVSINLRALDLVDADLLPVWEKLGGKTEIVDEVEVVTEGIHERIISMSLNENYLEKLPGFAENLEGKLPNLFGLAVYNNSLIDRAFHSIFRVIRHCQDLKMLNIRNNKMGDNGVSDMVHSFPKWRLLKMEMADISHQRSITALFGEPLLAQALSGTGDPLPHIVYTLEDLVEEPPDAHAKTGDLHLWFQTKQLRDDNSENLWIRLGGRQARAPDPEVEGDTGDDAVEGLHDRVQVLRVDNNYFATLPGFSKMFRGKFPNLELLTLDNNRLDDEGVNQLLDALLSEGSCASKLRELRLYRNDFSDASLKRLGEVLPSFPQLKVCTFKGNNHSSQTKQALTKLCEQLIANGIEISATEEKFKPKEKKAKKGEEAKS